MAKKYVVGIDIGAQTAKLGVVDTEGNILARSVIVTNDTDDADKFIGSLAAAVDSIIDEAGVRGEINGIGVGAPNGNYYTGDISYAPNLPWVNDKTIHFNQMLSDKLQGLKVTLTNDANAAAMGEMAYGATKGMKNFIMITLGTGVGSGIVIDGKMVYGHDGFAGELGHVNVIRGGRRCGCGKEGCLEAYCSAIGCAKTAREWLEMSSEPSLLRKVENITSKDIYDAAKAGDALAKHVFEYTGNMLGRTCADFVAFSAPEAIVFFGGLARSREFLEPAIVAGLNDNLLPIWKNKVKVLFSSLKESDAAILGASALAW